MAQSRDATWADASKHYQSSIGAISVRSAAELITMVSKLKPFNEKSYVLDVGCGPGAITLAVLAQNPNTSIEAIDTSPKMLEDLQQNIKSQGCMDLKLSTGIVDLHDIKNTFGERKFSHVVASYILHVAAKSFADSAADVYSILKTGGVFGLATFTPRSDPYIIWNRVCKHFDTEYEQPDFAPDPDAWVTSDQVIKGMKNAGLMDLLAEVKRSPFPIQGVEAWTSFMFEGRNPVSEALMRPFFDSHSADLEEVKNVFKKVMSEEWNEGSKIEMEYILAVGRKAE